MHKHPVRIQSGGTGQETIITLADGTSLDGVETAWISLDAQDINKVDITLSGPHVDVTAYPREINFTCPFCAVVTTHDCKTGNTLGGN